ncbi:hypothetical protein [Ottowia testudinis]|uniref:Uncharacterized protein n=1 Tax=Ottowia testudinis TaxID=2816950 RepID=A0A975CHE1_9BURK|nr:hypothetical protein [Ottowia testudinis]QTD46430.1 hypothetical protein J1M35_05970 [Ottowia testudinis]
MASVAGCAQVGTTTAVAPARVDRLAALFMQALPVGWIVERIAAQDPTWPFQQQAKRFTPAQLACTRGEMTPGKVAVTQYKDAREFARRHPDRVEESIRLLEGGAADVIGVLIRAGAVERVAGPPANPRELMGKMSAAQLRGFSEFIQDAQHADLRRAMRLEGIASATNDQQARQRGHSIGQSLIVGPLLTAMERCGVQPSFLFDDKVGTPA